MGRQEQGVLSGRGRYKTVPRTLCFILDRDDILLLKGAPNKRLWANRYNGIGGHIERDEDICSSALREICEETGWSTDDVEGLSLRALINVESGDPQTGVLLFLFTARSRRRDTRGSPEGTLEWVPRSKLLDYALVEDLPVLLPRVLRLPDGAPPLFAHYGYDQDDRLVIRFGTGDLPDTP